MFWIVAGVNVDLYARSRKRTLPEFSLLFAVFVIREGIAGDALGLDMYEAQRDGEELPRVDAALPADLEKLQELINEMTSFQPNTRLSSGEIQTRIHAINSEVTQRDNHSYRD